MQSYNINAGQLNLLNDSRYRYKNKNNGKVTISSFDDPASFKQFINDYLERMRNETNNLFIETQMKAREKARARNKSITKKGGTVSVSNTDSVQSCERIKTKLNAKLSEIFISDLEDGIKMALARSILMEIAKVDQKIAEIRRRERAVREERVARKDEKEHEKAKRRHDMKKRTVTVRKDLLYHASEGGLDPDSMLCGMPDGAAFSPVVAVDISGADAVSLDAAAVDVSVAASFEAVL